MPQGKAHMDYMRSRRSYIRTDPLDRLLAKTERRPSGCLFFTGKSTKNGYPVIGIGHNGWKYGHILVYERKVGPISPGHQVHHICEHELCLEETHLIAVTVRQHRAAHGHGVGPCRVCGADDWYIRPDNGSRQCRPCRRKRRSAC